MIISREGNAALPMAIAYAQYTSCLNRLEHDSCGTCSSCVKYEHLVHPDLHLSFPIFGSGENCDDFIQVFRTAFLENPMLTLNDWLKSIDGENKKPNINIRECRNIIRKLSLRPYESEFKVLVQHLDITLYVVRQGYTRRGMLRPLGDMVREGKLKHVDVVLNDVKAGEGYGYYTA